MRISSIYLLSFIVVASFGVVNQSALAGYCPGATNGKCPTQKTVKRKRADFSAEERAKIMENARQTCIKRYGASSRVYKFDYAKWSVICNTPGQ